MFEPGVTYNVDDRGAIITRAGARQAARLAGEAAAQQQAEEEAIAAGTPDEATEALLRGEHEYPYKRPRSWPPRSARATPMRLSRR